MAVLTIPCDRRVERLLNKRIRVESPEFTGWGKVIELYGERNSEGDSTVAFVLTEEEKDE